MAAICCMSGTSSCRRRMVRPSCAASWPKPGPGFRFAMPLIVRHLATVSCLLMLCCVVPGAFAQGPHSQDAIKAAYLYRFAGYVTWPEQRAGTPFVFDVLGSP